jgi:protein TonB
MSTAMPPGDEQPRQESNTASGGWLSPAGSVFGSGPQNRVQRAAGATIGSIAAHVLLVVLGIFLLTRPRPITTVEERPVPTGTLVYLEQVGPGGGGGGSPEPAPPRPVVIPRTEPPKPVPIPVVPPPVQQAPPPPSLSAPVMTPNAETPQASGRSVTLTAGGGGGGRGTGLGSGSGPGVGEGTGGGFGGGAFRPGAGISNPVPLRTPRPTYTSEAMRAKIQGVVLLEAVVQEDGSVGDVRILRSLDRAYGLDQEAIKAAQQWVFRPATDRQGKPVPILVTLELSFAIH